MRSYCLGAHLAYAELKAFIAAFFQGYANSAIDNKTEWKMIFGYLPANGLPMKVVALPASERAGGGGAGGQQTVSAR